MCSCLMAAVLFTFRIFSIFVSPKGLVFTVVCTVWQSVRRVARLASSLPSHLRHLLNVTVVILATTRTATICVMVSSTMFMLIVVDVDVFTFLLLSVL